MSAQPPPPVPDAETLRLHLGELTPGEVRVAQAAFRLALSRLSTVSPGTTPRLEVNPTPDMLAHFYDTAYLAEWHRQVSAHGIRPGFDRAQARHAATLAGVAEVARRVTQSIAQGALNVR